MKLHAVLTIVLLLGACSEPRGETRQSHDLVALGQLAVTTAPAGSGIRTSEEGEALFVPFGERVDFHLELEPQSVLRLDGVRFVGSSTGELEVLLATDDAGERRVARLGKVQKNFTLALTEELAEAARVSFVSKGEPAGGRSGALLVAASVWTDDPLAAARSAEARSIDSAKSPKRPNIFIFLVDTLRPDHLGCYGYSRPISPNVDRFAENSWLFEYAVGQSSWTKPSVASIFTGLGPLSHGAVGVQDRLPDRVTTIAEILSDTGYRTAAVFANPNVSTAFGFDQGFDDLVELEPDRWLQVEAEDVVDEAISLLEAAGTYDPLFLYVHTQDPHNPYLPPDEYRERFAPDSDEVLAVIRRNPRKEIWEPTASNIRQLKDLYDAEIAATDAGFGRLIRYLEESGLYERSLLIFVSDHGEEFFEHRRWGHGRNLHSEQLNVALLIKFPGQTFGKRVSQPVQHVDLLPTLLAHIGVETSGEVEGRALTERWSGNAAAMSFGRTYIRSHLHLGPRYSVVAGDFKLVQRWRKGKVRNELLFDWTNDPEEKTDLSRQRAIRAAVLAGAIRRMRETMVEREEVAIDEELADRLRALGYLN